MPFSRQLFESAGDAPQVVLDFLRNNSELAFTADEIAEGLLAEGARLERPVVDRALIELVANGRVEARLLLGMTCYIYAKRIGFHP